MKELYHDETKKQTVTIQSPIRVEMKTLTIRNKESDWILGIPDSKKRVKIYNCEKKWVDTVPIHLEELEGVSRSAQILIQSLENQPNGIPTQKSPKPRRCR
jgi:hypothetical protein